MPAPYCWGTNPDLIRAEAKERAMTAFKKGSPKGLTKLELAYYEVYCRNATTRSDLVRQQAS